MKFSGPKKEMNWCIWGAEKSWGGYGVIKNKPRESSGARCSKVTVMIHSQYNKSLEIFSNERA